jgi:cob(I)alamin adenosyltransferase
MNAQHPEETRDAKHRNVDPFETESSWTRLSPGAVCGAIREAAGQVESAVFSLLPEPTSRHLINAQKEMIQAGVRVVEILHESTHRWSEEAIQKLDEKLQRAGTKLPNAPAVAAGSETPTH